MKKLLALTLTGLMLTGLATTAFAAETNNGTAGTGSTSKETMFRAPRNAPRSRRISSGTPWNSPILTAIPPGIPERTTMRTQTMKKGWSTDTKTSPSPTTPTPPSPPPSVFDGSEGIVGSFDKSALNLETAEGTPVSEAPKGHRGLWHQRRKDRRDRQDRHDHGQHCPTHRRLHCGRAGCGRGTGRRDPAH